MVPQSFENLEAEKNEIENNQPEEPKINQNFATDEPKILNDGKEFLENPDITADPEDTGNVSY